MDDMAVIIDFFGDEAQTRNLRRPYSIALPQMTRCDLISNGI